ncbi:molybdopterin-dependent oxidoreductase [Massilia forsythiae]|uniref:nitrate reductase (cytochrome) n=1 Tax=Massilia forsythiae TaxID=2728020 RepID=A0A7Z2ZRJ0_9BURK|nr:nitrate reductase [Massilia forsythiae]QJD99124.1 molybdopterin-dependent oxidoreductase [Massilia forsythiae]
MKLSEQSFIQSAATVRTTCPYCGVGCGVNASMGKDGTLAIAGDADHPASRGRLCVKGSALGETVGMQGRLLAPMLRDADGDGGGALREATWDEALDKVAAGFQRIIAEHGPDAVALYVSGQLLTEDYYVANKFMKGYVGSANIDTNSRLCMSSAVAGHKRAFGEDVVPGCYEDFELADMIVLVGSNAAWCHPTLYQRIARAKEARPHLKIVVIDPRRTATCDIADLHLPLKPGADVALFNGLLAYLAQQNRLDAAFVAGHTTGLDDALAAAGQGGNLLEVARACRIDPQLLRQFYEWFAATDKVVTAFTMGVNQSSSGADKVNAIINCHLATGRIGKPGMGPFSLTGQPNAMGGREVGGLANMLAAHMDLDNPDQRAALQGFWQAPRMAERPGLKAVDLFQAIEAGKVKAVWIMATNPLVSMPDADQARRALAKCELVVASDIALGTDTNAVSHVLLPALGWGEKDGTVTNSERCISRQRGFLSAPGAARPDWHIICDVARRMGYAGFDFTAPHEIFDEHARLSAWQNGTPGQRRRLFDIGGLAGMTRAAYDALAPLQWPVLAGAAASLAAQGEEQEAAREAAQEADASTRLFGDGMFSFPDGRARFVATVARAPANLPDGDYPLVLNTGRVRDQWHTMTRTGKSPRLAEHVPEPFVDMHPQDALLWGVKAGELARVVSGWGSVVARVQHGGGIARGSVFMPIHWSAQTASDARVGAVVNPAVDPVSGEPEFKHTPVRLEPFGVNWYGFILSRSELPLLEAAHWTRIQGADFIRYELAGRKPFADAAGWGRALLGVAPHEHGAADDEGADWIEAEDRNGGVYRAAHLVDGRIEACLFVSRRQDLPARAWLAGMFAKERLAPADRMGLLSGRAREQGVDAGPTVCSCFGVGRKTIEIAIRQHGCKDAAAVTACVKAGGNCGSCIPEIRAILAEARAVEN